MYVCIIYILSSAENFSLHTNKHTQSMYIRTYSRYGGTRLKVVLLFLKYTVISNITFNMFNVEEKA